MGKLIARLVVGAALLYGVAATIFAFANYPGAKPDVPTILSDFHAWMGSLTKQRAGEQPTTPETPPSVPTPAPASLPEAPPAPGTPAPPQRPAGGPEAEANLPPEGLTGENLELWRIEHTVLPEATKQARALRTMTREDAGAFEAARTSVMASLGDARTLLNSILERDSGHRQANRLWNALQELYQAVKKL